MEGHFQPFGMRAALEGLRARGYRPPVVYDIGAADGKWTTLALEIWSDATVVCFEPLSERLPALRVLQDGHPGKVVLQPFGVGDVDADLAMGVTDSLYDSSFAYDGSSARKLPVRRLDSLVAWAGLPLPSFVKIDVQGFERRVLDGAGRVLPSADLVLMECQFIPFCPEMRTLDATVADMAQRGFIPYEFVDFLRRPLDGAMGQCDILFARRGHALLADTRWGA